MSIINFVRKLFAIWYKLNIKFEAIDGEGISIIYPENKMKGKEDEDLTHVLQNMILPDVFQVLDIEIPGAYIKG